MRFPAFRVKGAVYLKVTSRPPIFLWKGVGFDPSDVKYILQSGVSVVISISVVVSILLVARPGICRLTGTISGGQTAPALGMVADDY